MTNEPNVGDIIGPLRLSSVAHGGHWVARWEGRVYFVRHGLEDETVTLRITGLARRHGFADVVEVQEASPWRTAAPCPVATLCGGCDFQHVAAAHQAELKRQVVAEQLRRLAGIEWNGAVESVGTGVLGWRTRMRYHAGPQGWGLRRSRSHDVVTLPTEGCRLAVQGLAVPSPPLSAGTGRKPAPTLVGTAATDGVRWSNPGDDIALTEVAAGRTWRVSSDGFWQVHPRAADTLVEAVLGGLHVAPGERALDLYCGVGLFAGALSDAGARVTGVEGSRDAVTLARSNVPEATFHAGSVDRVLHRLVDDVDVVVLDPPRKGAGRTVVESILARRPRAVAYVACDPAGLARDLAVVADGGYRVNSVRAFDLFGSTHHVECVALCEPDAA